MSRQYPASAEGGMKGTPPCLLLSPSSAAPTPIPALPFVGLLTPLSRANCSAPGEAAPGASRRVRPMSRERRGTVFANVGADVGIAAEQHLPGSEPHRLMRECPGVVIADSIQLSAAFVHAIRRVGRIVWRARSTFGPGWKICVAKLAEFDYIRTTDQGFSVATQFALVSPGGFTVRPGHNFSRALQEQLQGKDCVRAVSHHG